MKKSTINIEKYENNYTTLTITSDERPGYLVEIETETGYIKLESEEYRALRDIFVAIISGGYDE